jgi:hypothetical protein
VVTVPIALVVGLLIGGAGSSDHGAQHPSASGSVLPPISASAPPSTGAVTVSKCAQVISALPLTLGGQDLRRTVSNPPSGQIQAWGDPAIVFRCGVSRPSSLVPGSSAQLFAFTHGGPFYDVTSSSGANTYTTVDRAIYIAVTVPRKYHSDPMPTLSRAIAKVLPAVCSTDPNEPDPAKLCTRRK